jgi:hypothetical protein
MMALEMVLRHHDGYSMGINNYRVYFDPATGRATFLPGGMDQLFHEPAASLWPELKGIMAKAMLETQNGRKELRHRCQMIYTNSFLGLSNFIGRSREALRPVLSEMDTKFVQRTDEAIANLLSRIRERHRQVGVQLSVVGHVPDFSAKGVELLTNWIATWERTAATMRQTNKDGQFVLETLLEPGRDNAVARWEALMLLEPGTYLFTAIVSTDQPVFRGPAVPAALDVWGVADLHVESQRLSPERMFLKCVFEVPTHGRGEYVLRCSSSGVETTVTCRFEAPHLTRFD